mmetsp:Transcript_9224/g.17619  ORF Transcript_9224/g.17619 Transcript_9224/m.17619 type:complete len:408 (+) Transcript_9224:2525-3748(+)
MIAVKEVTMTISTMANHEVPASTTISMKLLQTATRKDKEVLASATSTTRRGFLLNTNLRMIWIMTTLKEVDQRVAGTMSIASPVEIRLLMRANRIRKAPLKGAMMSPGMGASSVEKLRFMVATQVSPEAAHHKRAKTRPTNIMWVWTSLEMAKRRTRLTNKLWTTAATQVSPEAAQYRKTRVMKLSTTPETAKRIQVLIREKDPPKDFVARVKIFLSAKTVGKSATQANKVTSVIQKRNHFLMILIVTDLIAVVIRITVTSKKSLRLSTRLLQTRRKSETKANQVSGMNRTRNHFLTILIATDLTIAAIPGTLTSKKSLKVSIRLIAATRMWRANRRGDQIDTGMATKKEVRTLLMKIAETMTERIAPTTFLALLIRMGWEKREAMILRMIMTAKKVFQILLRTKSL